MTVGALDERRGLARWWPALLPLFVLAVQLGPLRLGVLEAPLLGFPVHHDDFRNLSYRTLADMPPLNVRPVSTFVLFLLSVAGPTAYYAALHLMVAGYIVLAIAIARRIFPAAGWPSAVFVALAASAALLFEHVPEYTLYSGLVTNLVSAVGGASAFLVLDLSPRSRRASVMATAAGVGLFAGSVFAKEDFALAVTAGFALRALERRLDGKGRARDLFVLAALLAVDAGFLAWSLQAGRTTFLRATIDTYRPDFSVASLRTTTWYYLTCTLGARLATGVQVVVVVMLALAGGRRSFLRALAALGVTLLLIAPYAALPRHVYPYYALNWTVWQSASLVALGSLRLESRRLARAGIVAAALAVVGFWAVATQPHRLAITRWYVDEGARNRAILRTVAGLGRELHAWPRLGITGVRPLNPWFGNDGAYMRNRLGLEQQFVVFADADYVERTRGLLRSLRMGSIEVRPVELLPASDFPVIALTAEGAGRVLLPAAAATRAPAGAPAAATTN